MDFAKVFVTIMLYLTFFTLIGSLLNIVHFPPPVIRYTIFSLPLNMGDVAISLNLFDPYFIALLAVFALSIIIIGALPFIDIDTRFTVGVVIGALLTISLGIMLDGSMITLPMVFRLFFVWVPIFTLGVSMFAMIVGGRTPG